MSGRGFHRQADHCPDVVYRYELRPRRRFSYVSPAATHLLGYTPEQHYADPDLILKRTHAKDLPLLRALYAGRAGPQPSIVRLRHKDGHTVRTEQRNVPVYDGDGALVATEVVVRDVTWLTRVEQQARLAAKCLAEQSKALAVLEERERFAMDLHDGVIQSLYAVALGLSTEERKLGTELPGTRQALRQSRVQVIRIIHDIRNYISGLQPQELANCRLRREVEKLVEELRINGRPHVELEVTQDVEGILDAEGVANLLHIIREAAANAIRHAQASAVTINLAMSKRQLVLTVGDDGFGFDQQSAARLRGYGLQNMAARARALGGRLTVASRPGSGTEVHLEVPVRSLQRAAS